MKKTLLITLAIIFTLVSFAQTPNSFKYQTVVRDFSGNVLDNHNVSFQISILQGSASGSPVYTETHSITTNDFGLVNINIGEGNTNDDFEAINWSLGLYFIQVELDENGGDSFSLMGTSQLLSVPYAMYAKDVENKDDDDADAANELINSATLNGTNLEINDAGGTTIIDLSSLDQSNMNVDDNDPDPNNELQTLSLSSNTLSLTNGGSVSLGQYSNIWQQNGTDIYYNNGWVGVGTDSPSGKMVVQGDASVDPDSALFEVKNKDGQTIFAVYDGGVRIWVDDTDAKINTDKGGFAVGGYRLNKSISNEYLRITPDSVRMYFDNENTSGTGHSGGFSVRSFNGTSGGDNGIMYLEEDNYFIGENSGEAISTGQYNSTFGYQSGLTLNTGMRNVFLGYKAGSYTTEGNDNVFIGNEAGSTNSKGWNNVVVGSYAGISLDTAGYNNVIIGKQAGQHLDNGSSNVFIGTQAGNSTTTGTGNVFIGDDAGLANDTGYYNIFMGVSSGYSNTYGANNIFLGTSSGESNTEGLNNNFIGYQAGVNNTTGSNNNFIGYQAGAHNTTGYANNIIGYQAGYNGKTGHENCYYGYQTAYTSTVGERNIFIGYHAAYASTGSGNYRDNIMIGDSAGLRNGNYSNIFIGNNAGQNNTQYENIYIGRDCAREAFAGQYNTYIGTKAGKNASGSLNTFVGNSCGEITTGDYNAFYGLDAGDDNTTGEYNTYIGTRSGGVNTTGNHNVTVGYESKINGDYTNSMALGDYAIVNANNTVRIGDGGVTSIGGYADWTNVSDKRFKKNIKDNVIGLDFILKLEPVTYNLDINKINDFNGTDIGNLKANKDKSNITYTGFLAQDVEKAAKELGYDFSGVDAPKNNKDHYGLRYATFVVPLVKAVQEQQKTIETQKAELDFLKQELKKLSDKVNQLENK